eukprot:9458882-Alexandrium_andersonii.AAC.1
MLEAPEGRIPGPCFSQILARRGAFAVAGGNPPSVGDPLVSALSRGGATRSTAPAGLGPALWGLQFLVADSRAWRGPFGPLARLSLSLSLSLFLSLCRSSWALVPEPDLATWLAGAVVVPTCENMNGVKSLRRNQQG